MTFEASAAISGPSHWVGGTPDPFSFGVWPSHIPRPRTHEWSSNWQSSEPHIPLPVVPRIRCRPQSHLPPHTASAACSLPRPGPLLGEAQVGVHRGPETPGHSGYSLCAKGPLSPCEHQAGLESIVSDSGFLWDGE